jgi:hypothetical protein
MKTSLLTIALVALAAAGCGGYTTTKESKTIIEKQTPVVETRKEIVVQPPTVVTHEIIFENTAPLRACTYSSARFSPGTLSCQSGEQVRCEDGAWVGRGFSC